jgi:hypothetical protein
MMKYIVVRQLELSGTMVQVKTHHKSQGPFGVGREYAFVVLVAGHSHQWITTKLQYALERYDCDRKIDDTMQKKPTSCTVHIFIGNQTEDVYPNDESGAR